MLISPPDVAIEHLYSPFTEKKRTGSLQDGSSTETILPRPHLGQLPIMMSSRSAWRGSAVFALHMIGAQVSELIAEVCLAMEFQADSEDVARTSTPIPTRSEACGRPPWASTDEMTQS